MAGQLYNYKETLKPVSAYKDHEKQFANGVFCDTVQRLYQGFCHFQNLTWFYCMHVIVISFIAVSRAWPSLIRLSQSSQYTTALYRALTLNFTQTRHYI